jgi:twinkle protein
MSKGVCIEKIAHDSDNCKSRNGVQVFLKADGTYDAHCFACNTHIPDPYKNQPKDYKPVKIMKTPEQIAEEIAEISEYRTVALPERKLRKESLEHFGIKIGVSEQDGETPVSHYYPYHKDGELTGYKVRLIEDKRMWSIGEMKGVDLFGWDQAIKAGGKKLFVCEGEPDAAALYQIFRDNNKNTAYADLIPAIVSLPHGAASAAKDLGSAIKEIRKFFKEIILVFDMDVAGRKAADEVLRIIPDAIVANLPAKDANDCLIEGRSKACYAACVFNAQKPKNTRLISGNDLHEKAKEPAKYGVSWPWHHITKATRGIRTGETIYIGAGQKQGKSEIVNTLAAHFIQEHDWKVFLIKPEEANNKTYKLVAGKLAGRFFHDPDKPFDELAYDKAGEILRDRLFMLNLYQHVDFTTLKGDIRQAALEGCKAIIIDPITNFTNGMSAADANTKLQEIAQELSAMALDLDVVIFIFCHLRNPESGLPHERGGEVLSSQFAGSRAMARSCNLMLGLQGNRDPGLDPVERNMRTLILLEDREYGETGRYGLFWDKATGLFNEI